MCWALLALIGCQRSRTNARLGGMLFWSRRRRRLLIARRGSSRGVRVHRLARRGCPNLTHALLSPHLLLLLLLLHHPRVEHLPRRESKALHRGGNKVGGRVRRHASFRLHIAIAARDGNLRILRLPSSAAHLGHHLREGEVPKLLWLLRTLARGRVLLSLVHPG